MQYITTRSFASVRRQYEFGETIDPNSITAAEWLRGVESGAIVPARFYGTAAEVAARGAPGPGIVVYETDTKQIKIGDGSTVPGSLPVAGEDTFLTKAGNLTGLADVATARTALGLGEAATKSMAQVAADAALTGTYAPYDGVIAAMAGGDVPAAPSFTRMARGLFTQAASGLDSLYSPWIIRVDDKLGSPLGRFYLYFSTNHALDAGGIGLAYADDPAGPWTVHPSNPVYVDTTANYQTENVSVIWDSDNDRFIGYYKADNTGLHTYAMTSPDGVVWTRVGQVITRPTNTPGDGLTGYFRPFRDGAMWRAYHLVGGGNLCYMAMSHSYDGLTWKTDPRPLMYDVDISGSNTRRIDWHGSTPVRYKGQLWLLGTLSDFTSGGTTGYPTQFVCPLSADHRTPLAPPITVASTLLSGETTPDSFGNAIFYNGALYTCYVSDGSTSPTAGGTGGGTMAYARGI